MGEVVGDGEISDMQPNKEPIRYNKTHRIMAKMVYTRETARTYKEQVQKICDYPELWDRAESVCRRLAELQEQGFPLLPALNKINQTTPYSFPMGHEQFDKKLRPDAKLATQAYIFVKQLQCIASEIASLESMKLAYGLRINCKEVDEFALTQLERLLEILDPD